MLKGMMIAMAALVALVIYGQSFLGIHSIESLYSKMKAVISKTETPTAHQPHSSIGSTHKKCVQGTQIIYTDSICPSGFKSSEISSGSVTILPSNSSPTPSDNSNANASNNKHQGAKSALHEALDLKPDAQLKEKMMDKAMTNF